MSQEKMEGGAYSRITPEIQALTRQWDKNAHIDRSLYEKYDVKRGLRDATGRGVLTSLTRISEVKGYTVDGQDTIPCPGVLYCRGYDVRELVQGALADRRFGFEEVFYLLLMGQLPTEAELARFRDMLAEYRQLPKNFVRDVVMKAPTRDMMNTLARSILTLYCYDDKANDIALPNVLRQCMQLTVNTPQLVIYGYQAWRSTQGEGLYLHAPRPELSAAEKGHEEPLAAYRTVERVGRQLLEDRTGRPVATNVDFYSGLLYGMLGLPQELFTPLFAVARMAGWSAHRMEELGQGGKIIRPATKCVEKRRAYVPMAQR